MMRYMLWITSFISIFATSIDGKQVDLQSLRGGEEKARNNNKIRKRGMLEEGMTEITVDKTLYIENENIAINWSFGIGVAQDGDWIGVYPESRGTSSLPAGSELWIYCQSGSQSYVSTIPDSTGSTIFGPGGVDEGWPLASGSYRAHLLRNSIAPYTVVASSAVFQVEGNTCPAAFADISDKVHLAPKDTDKIDRIAFSSCYKPDSQKNDKLWKYLRDPFCKSNTCAWAWLGDNMYFDTDNMEDKRGAYNNARNDQYYSTYGPVAEPKIPTTGTWDDHDYAWNNMGKHYSCKVQSQAEFVHHFNVPETDPRHPNQYPNQQEGIYSANMFQRLDGTPNGIHLINVDARYHRSLSFPKSYAACEGASSTMLGQTQWEWLQNELNRPSDIKVIASGIQVLPPTNKNNVNNMCAYRGGGQTSFEQANDELGEGGSDFSGTSFESWGEFPQERTKLLRMVQKSVADGNTKQVIFISGDQHWAEISVKDIPAIDNIPEVRVHEVTASGIDQWWNSDIPNPNRLKLRETDSGNECAFPFTYQGVEYNDCTMTNHDREWCYTDALGSSWSNCKPYNDIYSNIIASKERVCTDSAVHVCNAQANFGGITVDWEDSTVSLSIFTPHEVSPVAASVTFPLVSTPPVMVEAVSVSKSSYSVGEAVTVNFQNPTGKHVWIGVYSADADPGNLNFPRSEDWAWACGTKDCQERWLTSGTVSLNDVGQGTWRVFIMSDVDLPYEALAWSDTFVVESQINPVSTSKSSYSVGETVVVNFQNPSGDNMWLGVYQDGSDPNILYTSEDWAWPCGSKRCRNHSLPSGTVNLVSVGEGTWRVHLIRDLSLPYMSEAYSEVFVVS